MGKPLFTAGRFSEGAGALHAVEAFASGTHRDKEYSPADVDDMARNFNRLSVGPKALLKVPAVIGHEEEQEKLESSDLPAAGWGDRAWARWQTCPACKGKTQIMGEDGGDSQPCTLCDGHGKRRVLMLNFADVPDEVAPLIDGKAYRKVSAEVYDDPPDGLPGKGRTLRRVAFLGADVPQVKGLADIPRVTKSSERRFARHTRVALRFCGTRASKTPGAFWCFSEVQRCAENDMDRDEMIAELQKHGADADALKDTPDAALAEMLRVCESKDDGGNDDSFDDDDNPSDEGDPFAEFADDLPDPKDDAEKQEYAERARKYAARVGRFAARGRKYMEKYCAMRHDDAPVTTETADQPNPMDDNTSPQPKKTTVTHQFSERQLNAAVDRAVACALTRQVKSKMDRFEKFTEQQLASQKKATVEAFCEEQLKAGRVLPFELDRADPANLFDELMRADAAHVVTKFREGKQELALTEFDLKKRAILQRPVRLFAERVRQAPAGGKGGSDASEKKQWAENTFEKFRENFAVVGISRADFVATAEKANDVQFETLQATYAKRSV